MFGIRALGPPLRTSGSGRADRGGARPRGHPAPRVARRRSVAAGDLRRRGGPAGAARAAGLAGGARRVPARPARAHRAGRRRPPDQGGRPQVRGRTAWGHRKDAGGAERRGRLRRTRRHHAAPGHVRAVEPGDRGVQLESGDRLTVTGATSTGVFHGTRTVLQLLREDRTAPAGTARLPEPDPQVGESDVGVADQAVDHARGRRAGRPAGRLPQGRAGLADALATDRPRPAAGPRSAGPASCRRTDAHHRDRGLLRAYGA